MGANWPLGILNCPFQKVAPRHGPQLGPETAGLLTNCVDGLSSYQVPKKATVCSLIGSLDGQDWFVDCD